MAAPFGFWPSQVLKVAVVAASRCSHLTQSFPQAISSPPWSATDTSWGSVSTVAAWADSVTCRTADAAWISSGTAHDVRPYGSTSTLARMKTTIDLPDELARRAKAVARQHNVTLRELVTEGLRAQLDRVSAPRQPATFRFRTVGGAGLKRGVTAESLTERAYDAS